MDTACHGHGSISLSRTHPLPVSTSHNRINKKIFLGKKTCLSPSPLPPLAFSQLSAVVAAAPLRELSSLRSYLPPHLTGHEPPPPTTPTPPHPPSRGHAAPSVSMLLSLSTVTRHSAWRSRCLGSWRGLGFDGRVT
eukprot:1442182-Rhodomonas_salina.1